jgi:MFS family permease
VIVCGTLIGVALLTLWVGMIANRHSRRRLLLAASLPTVATGAGFAVSTAFWPLLVIAIVGTINPTAGDASVFSPVEQTVLTHVVEPRRRTALFARYSVVGSVAGALGVLAAAAPDLAASWTGCAPGAAMQAMFGLYAVLGITSLLLYRLLSPAIEANYEAPPAPLSQSRGLYGCAVRHGFVRHRVSASIAACAVLYQSFSISVATAASILFWTSICSAISYLVAVPIAARIGLINTMVFTHLLSNVLLILIPFAPDLTTAIGLLLARSALSQMDVPTRSSYVMAVVTPGERPAAASLTAVPKTFAWGAGSIIAGYLLAISTFGWPLVIAGVVKGVYDILLLINFQKVRPPEEVGAPAG